MITRFMRWLLATSDVERPVLHDDRPDQPVVPVVHGKLLDDTRLCPAGEREFATVFMSIVNCPSCVRAARDRGIDARRCRGCGCTDDHACQPACWWMADDLCSTCDSTGRAR